MSALSDLSSKSRHLVVICGGAVSGSEAAAVCAEHGLTVVVLEQNVRPYGKIEDGLPRWHDKLRAKEYAAIDANLNRDGVYFVPQTRLGEDLSFERLLRGWGASAVLLANGAWRDRPLPVPRAEELPELGLVYQNAFVHWFNHSEDPSYDGPQYQVSDGAVVVGGGLASVDVAKIINLELYRAALRARGIDVSVVQLEHQGIPETLKKNGLSVDELNVQGCTLYYRRRVRDMPLAFPKSNATPEQIAKVETVREKMVGILREKFRVRVQDCSAPVSPIVEAGKLKGLVFRKTEMQGGKLQEVPGSEFEARAELVVSSIGSVPLAIEGVPTKGELYDYTSWDTGELRGLPGVFGLGNVLTGKGNIKDSRENAKEISDRVIAQYLGLTAEREALAMTAEHAHARVAAEAVVQSAIRRAKVPTEKLEHVAQAIAARWEAAGYDGDYASYLAKHPPAA